ncbi:manganese-dependent ADP-ribose/CDP-alcohol diphosphatase-like isoform X2 [Acanthaster planci]|uniref:Manganese-dependent ADP-ribose/CDP-alcohol diphosphatase-like isoform X2 n=1 Tax=Acanthaster planci TaxID=133434 RepID=A0A8B7Y884_ACAPL|nr:manganese-dependent ADP-ribose/CDP-alcohol diphosphatase-like isoform X2 [Acanthaster planci]
MPASTQHYIQYADLDNRLNSVGTHTRYYRNALALLKEAVDCWTGDIFVLRPDFVMQLGDIIDGFNNKGGKAQSLLSLAAVLGQFNRLPCFVHHVLGNHEFYNFTRAELMNSRLFSGADFEMAPRDPKCHCFDIICNVEGTSAYYHFSPAPGFRFVVLDTFSESIIGHDDMCPISQESLRLVCSINKNEDLDSSAGLKISEKRYLSFNGALGEKQLEWLEGVLQEACFAKEKIVLFGHVPIYPINGDHADLLWDYQEALKILCSYRCVVAAFAGHTHHFSHCVDKTSGIHFVNLPGIVEVPPGSNGFGTVQVFSDRLLLYGVGQTGNLEMMFPGSVPAD